MKRFLPITLTLFLLAGPAFGQDAEKAEDGDADLKKKASYVFGHNFGKRLEADGLEIDLEQFLAGFSDAYGGMPSKLKPEESRVVMQKFQQVVAAKQKAKAEADAKDNLENGKKFLADNAKKDGVKTTKSGLQYKVEKEGTGKSPKATDVVKVHYHGTLLDGEVFDSSVQREEPATFPLNGVIKGWTEGLQLMKVGGKTTFYIPSDLAYGKSPRGPGGPNSTLVFEVELLDIVDKDDE